MSPDFLSSSRPGSATPLSTSPTTRRPVTAQCKNNPKQSIRAERRHRGAVGVVALDARASRPFGRTLPHVNACILA